MNEADRPRTLIASYLNNGESGKDVVRGGVDGTLVRPPCLIGAYVFRAMDLTAKSVLGKDEDEVVRGNTAGATA